jgi:transposase-like protein
MRRSWRSSCWSGPENRVLALIGRGGLLSGPTKTVETALEAELTEHPGHERGQTPLASNARERHRSKTC